MNVHSLIITMAAGMATAAATVGLASAPDAETGLKGPEAHDIDMSRMMPVRASGVSVKRVPAPAPAPSRAIAAPRPGFEMRGSLLYSQEWGNQAARKPYGIYSATYKPGETLDVGSIMLDARLDATTGAVMTPEGYFVISTTPYMGYYLVDHYLFDPSDWTVKSKTAADMETMARSLAYNPADKLVYGSFANLDGTFSFSSLDVKSGKRKKITLRSEEPFHALACDAEGTLYAIDAGGDLLRVDTADGSATLLHELDLPSAYVTSAVYDEASRSILYVQAREDATELFSIDPGEGTVFSLGLFPNAEQWGGIYVAAPEAADAAPAAPSGLTAAFEGGSLSGTVSFTAPTLLFDGTEAAGEMGWTLRENGLTLAEGRCVPGEEIVAEVTMEEPGVRVFSVSLANEAGEGPAVSTTTAVGPDIPVISGEPSLSLDPEDGRLRLRWNAPTRGANGGWVDPSRVTYDIIRYPGGETAAEGVASTDWSEPAPDGEALTVARYGIVAVNEGRRGTETLSNPLALGRIQLPYEVDFRAPGALDAFHIIDANGDGITWTPDEKHSAYVDYSSQVMNDWLISAPVELKRGMVYTVTVDAWSQSVRYDERIAVWIGSGMDVSSMTKRLTSRSLDGHPAPFRVLVTVEKDGLYNLGIQGCSPAGQYVLRLGSLTISEPVAQTAPEAPRVLSLTPDETGELIVDGRILLPVKASDGSTIGSLTGFTLWRGEEEIMNLENPLPGQIITFTDEVEEAGRYTYRMQASSEVGAGVATEMEIYVGVNVPANPEKVNCTGMPDGSRVLGWEPVTKAIDGMTLNTREITYHIYDKEFRELGSVADTSLILPPKEEDENPDADIYYLRAATKAGENPGWECSSGVVNSNAAADGILRIPFYDLLDYSVGLIVDEAGEPTGANPWVCDRPVGYHTIPDMIVARNEVENSRSVLVLPPVTVGEDSPEFGLVFAGMEEDIVPEVRVLDNGVIGTVSEGFIDKSESGRIRVRLDEYVGRTVNVVVVASDEEFIIFDITMECVVPVDIRLNAYAPSGHTYGRIPVRVSVSNAGSLAVADIPVRVEKEIIGEDEETGWETIIEDNIDALERGDSNTTEYLVDFPRYREDHLCVRVSLGEIPDNDGRFGEERIMRIYYADGGYPSARDTEASVWADLEGVDVRWERPAGLDDDGVPAEGKAALSGYKVYADHTLIGETDAATTEYSDELGEERRPDKNTVVRYTIVACYGDEEAEPGKAAPVMIMKAELIAGDAGSAMRAEQVGDEVLIFGASADVEVLTPSGIRVARLGRNAADESSPLRMRASRGIYILTDGKSTLRLLID